MYFQIRDCEVYKDEYDECTSFKGRFHQYFIYGKSLDCNPWKKDYDNCCKWVDNQDVKAGVSIILYFLHIHIFVVFIFIIHIFY